MKECITFTEINGPSSQSLEVSEFCHLCSHCNSSGFFSNRDFTGKPSITIHTKLFIILSHFKIKRYVYGDLLTALNDKWKAFVTLSIKYK